MKKSLFGFCLIVLAFLGGRGQLLAKADSETTLQSDVLAEASQLVLPVVELPSSRFYGPVPVADEESELRIEEKEEKEEQDQKEKANEFQFYNCRASSLVAMQRHSLKLSSKLYLLQAVLRI